MKASNFEKYVGLGIMYAGLLLVVSMVQLSSNAFINSPMPARLLTIIIWGVLFPWSIIILGWTMYITNTQKNHMNYDKIIRKITKKQKVYVG